MQPKIVKVRDWLDDKWHHEKHDTPKPCEYIVVMTHDGEYFDGFVYKGMFYPCNYWFFEKIKSLSYKKWRYGKIDKQK